MNSWVMYVRALSGLGSTEETDAAHSLIRTGEKGPQTASVTQKGMEGEEGGAAAV